MLVTTRAIVISATKYQDHSLIVKCYTQSHGLKSYFLHHAFSSKSAKRKLAYYQPLSQLEIVAQHKNNGQLNTIKEVKLAPGGQLFITDIVKTSIALFLSEMFHHALKEEMHNEELFTFLSTALEYFNHRDQAVNFHLILLLQLTRYLGFYPAKTSSGWSYFNPHEGAFESQPSALCYTDSQTALWQRLLSLRLDNTDLVFSSSERQELLKLLIQYYELHLDGFNTPNSHAILRDIFAD